MFLRYPVLPTSAEVGKFLFWSASVLWISLFAAQTCNADQEVLIWYVNETAPAGDELRNYEVFIDWLESGETEKSQKLARTLRTEITLFQAEVDREQAAIEAETRAAGGRLETLIVTNRLARDGKYRYFDRQSNRFLETSFDAPPSTGDYVLDGNPLVRREFLTAVLREAAHRYDPTTHHFVLVTKSHGSPVHALSVRLPRHHEEVTREQLLASMAGEAVDVPPAPSIGVGKSEYFSVIDAAGDELGMRFSLVFIEACRGIFEPGEEQRLPTNVQLLYTSGDRSLKYTTLDYPMLFAQVNDQTTLADAIDDFLGPRYMALYRESGWQWWNLLWFSPLAVMLLWMTARFRRSRLARPSQTDLDLR